MQATRANCFTPKAARSFFRDWIKRNKVDYNFLTTPRGPVIFYKIKDGYMIKNPISMKWFEVNTIDFFILNVGEILAICFREGK